MKQVPSIAGVAILSTLMLIAMGSHAQRTTLSPSSTTHYDRSESGLLFSSFNTVLGSIINLTYNDPAVLRSIRAMRVSGVRHIGGVSNFWNLMDARITLENANDPDWDPGAGLRRFQARAAGAYPAGTFSAPNFVSQLAPHLYDGGNQWLPITFVLNLFTLSPADQLRQVDYLANNIPNARNRIRYIELGNEMYFSFKANADDAYGNPQTYADLCKPVIRRIRQRLPNTLIGVTGTWGWKTPQSENTYSQVLARELKDQIDAVIIHNYNAFCDTRGQANSKSAVETALSNLALFGSAVLPAMARDTKATFGQDKQIWMTEYNIIKNSLVRSRDDSDGGRCPELRFGVGRMLYLANMMITAACNTDKSFNIMMQHLLWDQKRVGWGYYQAPIQLPRFANQMPQTQFDVMAVFYSRFNYYAQELFQNTYCVDQSGTNAPTRTMPNNYPGAPRGQTLNCISAVQFGVPATDGATRFAAAAVVLNACPFSISNSLVLDFTSILPAGVSASSVTASADFYAANVGNDGVMETVSFTPFNRNCANGADGQPNPNLWECTFNGNMKAREVSRLSTRGGAGRFQLGEIEPLSLAFVEIKTSTDFTPAPPTPAPTPNPTPAPTLSCSARSNRGSCLDDEWCAWFGKASSNKCRDHWCRQQTSSSTCRQRSSDCVWRSGVCLVNRGGTPIPATPAPTPEPAPETPAPSQACGSRSSRNSCLSDEWCAWFGKASSNKCRDHWCRQQTTSSTCRQRSSDCVWRSGICLVNRGGTPIPAPPTPAPTSSCSARSDRGSCLDDEWCAWYGKASSNKCRDHWCRKQTSSSSCTQRSSSCVWRSGVCLVNRGGVSAAAADDTTEDENSQLDHQNSHHGCDGGCYAKILVPIFGPILVLGIIIGVIMHRRSHLVKRDYSTKFDVVDPSLNFEDGNEDDQDMSMMAYMPATAACTSTTAPAIEKQEDEEAVRQQHAARDETTNAIVEEAAGESHLLGGINGDEEERVTL